MRPFSFQRASALDDVTADRRSDVALLAGGTELTNWLRIGIATPSAVIDISRLPGLSEITTNGDAVRIGALTALSDVAAHPQIRDRFPVLSQAIDKSASAQLRNLATIGGNPLQMTRCPYFRSGHATACNKRRPGSGCAALHGLNERHAIFGWTEDCVAVQPSDPATALAALDAIVVIAGADGERRLPFAQLHTLPGDDPFTHHVLRPGEVITGFEVAGRAPHSAYLKVRERESYEFAIVSVAAAIELSGRRISRARLALGSVAMRPWRLTAAEAALKGLAVDSPEIEDSIAAGFTDARALSGNAYKIPLAQRATRRAIAIAVAA
jgi:xanthine dehydrogenase YagS FAD-binding subunit